MKRYIAFALLLAALLSLCGCLDIANESSVKTYKTEEYVYQIENDKVIITKYTGVSPNVDLPKRIDDKIVNAIGENAFYGSAIHTVTIPDTVLSIGKSAFSNCSFLSYVKLPARLKTIEQSTFFFCSSLKNVTIPSYVHTIGDYAFTHCSALDSITIPMSVKTIGDSAFKGCGLLKEVTFEGSMNSIGRFAFSECDVLEQMTLPVGIDAVKDHLFYSCGALSKVVLPETVTKIEYLAFYGCKSLNTLVLNEGLQSLDDVQIFDQCFSLKNIIIPKTVTTMSYTVLTGNPGLKNMYFEGDAPEITDGDIVIGRDKKLHYKKGTLGWDAPAFSNCTLVEHEQNEHYVVDQSADKNNVPAGFLVGMDGYLFRDINGDGNDELIVKKELEITVLNMVGGFYEIGSYNFRTGTLRLLESDKYPGIIVFTVGGGANRYRYMTIKEGKLAIEDVYNDYYAFDDVPDKELTNDKTLIDEALLAYQNNQDIDFK